MRKADPLQPRAQDLGDDSRLSGPDIEQALGTIIKKFRRLVAQMSKQSSTREQSDRADLR